MDWYKKLKVIYLNMLSIKKTFEQQREDINSNTSDCAKLLYRLEEVEIAMTILSARVEYLQASCKLSSQYQKL